MGFRFSRRVGGNNGLGFNISKSGVSPSYRTRFGSIGGKGFSVRSGFPGLSFFQTWGGGGRRKKGNEALILFFMILAVFIAYWLLVLAFQIIKLVFYTIVFFVQVTINFFRNRRLRKQYNSNIEDQDLPIDQL
jgi:fatty acid desaturase